MAITDQVACEHIETYGTTMVPRMKNADALAMRTDWYRRELKYKSGKMKEYVEDLTNIIQAFREIAEVISAKPEKIKMLVEKKCQALGVSLIDKELKLSELGEEEKMHIAGIQLIDPEILKDEIDIPMEFRNWNPLESTKPP